MSDASGDVDLAGILALAEACAAGRVARSERPPTADELTDPGPIPEHLFNVPGFVSEVMAFTLANAPYPNAGLAFCGAMALQSYLCGRKVCDAGDLRSNIFLLALASSGTGKDFPRKVNSQVLFKIGHLAALGDKFASGPDANDHKLRLYHGDWDAANTNKTGNLMSLGAPGANVTVVDGAVAPGPGTAWFTFTEYEDEYDDKKHSKVRAKAGAKKLVIDGIGKVFTDANDTTPGFLDDEIVVTPQSGHAWLKKTVEPGGAADNKLLLEHNTQGPKDSEIDPIAAVAVVDVDGTPTLRITARKSGHDARGHHTGDAGNEDHDVVVADEKVKSWEEDPNAGYLLDKIEGDGFWIVKSLQNNRIVLEHGPPQWEDPNYTVVFEGDPHIEVLEGSAGFGDPKIPVDANGHITSNLGIQVTHKYPQDETWTLDPVVSLSLNGTSLRVTSKPASVDSKGHMRQGGASGQYHDLSMEAITVVTAFRVEDTDLQVKTRTIYVPKADAESDWTTVHTGTECPSSGGS